MSAEKHSKVEAMGPFANSRNQSRELTRHGSISAASIDHLPHSVCVGGLRCKINHTNPCPQSAYSQCTKMIIWLQNGSSKDTFKAP